MRREDEPAFASTSIGPHHTIYSLGLTKREYFAAQAMQGLLSQGVQGLSNTNDFVAAEAWRLADMMLTPEEAKGFDQAARNLGHMLLKSERETKAEGATKSLREAIQDALACLDRVSQGLSVDDDNALADAEAILQSALK